MSGYDENVRDLHHRLIEVQKIKTINEIYILAAMVPYYSNFDNEMTDEAKTLFKRIRELAAWIDNNV